MLLKPLLSALDMQLNSLLYFIDTESFLGSLFNAINKNSTVFQTLIWKDLNIILEDKNSDFTLSFAFILLLIEKNFILKKKHIKQYII